MKPRNRRRIVSSLSSSLQIKPDPHWSGFCWIPSAGGRRHYSWLRTSGSGQLRWLPMRRHLFTGNGERTIYGTEGLHHA